MIRWTSAALATLLFAGACLASKSDIRLLQDDLRATRELIAKADAASAQRDTSMRSQLIASANAAAATTARMNDSLRAISQRLATFQALTSGQLEQVVRDVIQTQALLGQTTRNLQDMRARAEAMTEAASAAAAAPAPPGDTTGRPSAGVPSAVLLFQNAFAQLKNGANTAARRGFEELLKNYPNADEAPAAQLHIGEAFINERNQAAADSVYQLVVTRYPKSAAAPTALYKRGMMYWDANKKPEARRLFQRVVSEYPGAIEVDLAKGMLDRR